VPSALCVHWPRQPAHFGFWLTGPILARHGLGAEWTPAHRAELTGCGGVLDAIPDVSRTLVLGSGFHHAHAIARFENLSVLAVRGRLSAEKIGAPHDVLLADLTLLAPDTLATPAQRPGLRLGIVADRPDDIRLDSLRNRHAQEIVVIPARTRDAAAVVAQIAACTAVWSDSAAGIAAAWACGVPAAFFSLGQSDDDTRFALQDFLSAFPIGLPVHEFAPDPSPAELTERCIPPPAAVAEKQQQLRSILARLRAEKESVPTPEPLADPVSAARQALTDDRPEAAVRLLRMAPPRDPRVLVERARAQHALGEFTEASATLLAATRLAPQNPDVLFELGRVFEDRHQLDLALDAYAAAARAAPDSPALLNRHALALAKAGQIDAALEIFHDVVRRFPSFRRAHDNLLYYLPFQTACTPAVLRRERAEWNGRHARPFAATIAPHDNSRDPERPLRVGYVAPEFRAHALSSFTLPLFAHHDARHFEVFAYALGRERDTITHRLRAHLPHWREVADRSDDDIAAQIRADRIDVLVDLAQHLANNRLLVFAQKPAPVQVAWIAYPGGTGLEAMDYRLTDRTLEPGGTDDDLPFERPYRLPHSFWCYDPLASTDALPVTPLPALARKKHVTFGCLNSFNKVNDATLALWARVLNAVPRSHLLLLVPSARCATRVRSTLAAAGVAPERIAFTGRLPRHRYLALHGEIDVALDPIPVGGHTTLCDGLWMGVPTLALPGSTAMSRAGASLLHNAGLSDWVAASADDYVRLAVEKTSDLAALAALRARLRPQFASSPVMDAPAFARDIEQAYRHFWREWCRRQSAR
jgi:tetratricopeptide (TPR) repeat protein